MAFLVINPQMAGIALLAFLAGVATAKAREAFDARDWAMYQLLLASVIGAMIVGGVVFVEFIEAPLLAFSSILAPPPSP